MVTKNKVYSSNGLRFKENMKNRPTIRGLRNGEFMIHLEDGRHLVINKKEVNDLAILFREVKDRDYLIEDD
ncbi:hypothetical protein [Cytobacillus praedii]|uniref:hypothetical protein n=1 Tax=Cytobacillus praedii TaxID=1742358 RepID=UPI00103DC209|nr:hypothetical protein [Cytobacillus praedii]